MKQQQISRVLVTESHADDGTGAKQITNTAGMKWYLGVSTRGRMVYDTADEKDGKLGRIYSLEMDGSGLTLLTK